MLPSSLFLHSKLKPQILSANHGLKFTRSLGKTLFVFSVLIDFFIADHLTGPGRAIGPACVSIGTITFELNDL